MAHIFYERVLVSPIAALPVVFLTYPWESRFQLLMCCTCRSTALSPFLRVHRHDSCRADPNQASRLPPDIVPTLGITENLDSCYIL